MPGLTLREEFRGKRLKGTAIEMSNNQRTGATRIAARQFLEITYPTHDLLKGIDAVSPNQGRPVVVIGERGLGKSHLMAALFHAVTDPRHRALREKAQQNIISVREARRDHASIAPHLQELVGALWLRSIAVGNLAGAEPATLQRDITRDKPVDDNAFQAELATIVENSFNIHREGAKLLFREEENPRAKLMAYARNDKLFADGADQAQLARQVRYVIGGSDEVAKTFRVIALSKSWGNDPWTSLDDAEQPEKWDDRLPILVLPEEPEKLDAMLGRWLKDQLQKRRNTLRFLLPRTGSINAFQDRDLLILARAEMKAQEWSGQNPEYKKLHKAFENTLRDNLKKRFDRFAVLHRWNFGDPAQCRFSVERLDKQGSRIPEAIEEALTRDLFVPEDFENLALEFAIRNERLGGGVDVLKLRIPVGGAFPACSLFWWACLLYPMPSSISPTVTWLTPIPCCSRSALATERSDSVVHDSTRPGSPSVRPPTISRTFPWRPTWASSTYFRPPPLRLTHSLDSPSGLASSFFPAVIVFGATPVSSWTTFVPP